MLIVRVRVLGVIPLILVVWILVILLRLLLLIVRTLRLRRTVADSILVVLADQACELR
jgi:hypothetical protein